MEKWINERRDMRLAAMRYGGDGITLFEFQPLTSTVVPFTAGSHVDLYLPNGLVRQYSLANDPREKHRYVLGVKREPTSRGGSRFMHDELRLGMTLPVGVPRNNFPLNEQAAHSVFVAGGIGITPIRAMIIQASRLGLSWELHYAVRKRQEAVFFEEWNNDCRVHLHVNEENAGMPPNLDRIALSVPITADVYCCGPQPMIGAFDKAFSKLPASRKHVEYFAAPKAGACQDGAFQVRLSRSGVTLEVSAQQSILQAVRAAGVDASSSCEEGVCGMCEVKVLAGIPDHRDLLLSPEEKTKNNTMLICCSRSLSTELVLDL